MSYNKIPKTQKALVFQGGCALEASNAGVFKALYEKIGQEGNRANAIEMITNPDDDAY